MPEGQMILKCPWCGSQPYVHKIGYLCPEYQVRCRHHTCRADGPAESTESEAVSEWNRVVMRKD